MATMGLHGQNYNVDMAQADQYAKAIKELNAEIAKIHITLTSLNVDRNFSNYRENLFLLPKMKNRL